MSNHPPADGPLDARRPAVDEDLAAEIQRFRSLEGPAIPDAAGGVAALAAAAAHVGHAIRRHRDLIGHADALRGFQSRIDAHGVEFHASLALEVPQQHVGLNHVRRRLHLGKQDAVQTGAGDGFPGRIRSGRFPGG